MDMQMVKELLLHCAKNDVRPCAIAGAGGLGMLDLYEEVDRVIPLRGRRWTIAHINVVSPRDVSVRDSGPGALTRGTPYTVRSHSCHYLASLRRTHVSTAPGRIAFTRMRGARSEAISFVACASAAFAVPYAM